MPTVGTAFGRRVPPIDRDEGAPIPAGFVFQLAYELAPSDITDTLGQSMVLDQIFDGQTLDADQLILADDAARELVLVIPPSVSDTRMDSGNFEASLCPVLTTLFLLGQPSLCFRQLLLVFGKLPGVADGLSCRKHHHRGEAQVKPDHLAHHWKRLDLLFDQDGDEVAVGCVFGDCDGGWLAALGERAAPPDSESTRARR